MSKVAVIELKGTFGASAVTKLIDEIIMYHSLEDSVVISFSQNNLLNVREQADIELHYLTSGDKDESFDFCIDYGINISMQYTMVRQNDYKKAHDNGIKLGVWTVNDSVSNFNMKRLQVDYVTSDEFFE